MLIVDDNMVNLRVAAGVMKPYKLQITTALSGYDALDLIKEHEYDLIFMDHMMPEMDGVDTTKRIRELDDGKYKDIPVIALTANTISESREYLLNNGMQDFLAKPIDRKTLNEIINKWLK